MIEVQRVRLQDLTKVHQAADPVSRRRNGLHPYYRVERLGRTQVMADRANTAEPLHHHRYLPVRASLHEALEAPKLHDVKTYLLHAPLIVEQDGDLAVPFDAGHGLDHDL